ncbi:MAG: SRPBCC family protein [Gemmatimonadaceae bacterium]
MHAKHLAPKQGYESCSTRECTEISQNQAGSAGLMQELAAMKLLVTRSQPSFDPKMLLGGIGIGAALMYYLDPSRGARRRGLLRDRVTHGLHVAGEAAGTTTRDLANRARGLAAEARSLGEPNEADDRVLEARVRAELGRVVSHPSAIEVMAENGRVTLAGDVLASEAHRLIRRVERVNGVDEVNNRLRLSEHAEGIPALQGGEPRTGEEFELRQENWTPAARFLTSVAGGAMALYGVSRRDRFGSAMGLAGLALLARGATNRELGRVIGVRGGRHAIDIRKTVNIDAPIDDVFAFLTDWENLPHWMSHVRAVRSSGPRAAAGERTHWEVDGPAGSIVAWDAVTTRFVPNELVAWKSVEGAAIRQAGRMRFERNDDGTTRVHIELQYNPPAGVVGHAVASLFRRDPKHLMDDDLARLKTAIETGHPARDAAASAPEAATEAVPHAPKRRTRASEVDHATGANGH